MERMVLFATMSAPSGFGSPSPGFPSPSPAAQSEWAKSYALKDMEGFKGFVDKAPVVVPQGRLDLKDAPASGCRSP